MNRRGPFILQRKPIFVGCEGESERGYVAFLNRLARDAGKSVHLDPILLQPGGGDPLDLVKTAIKKYQAKVRIGRGPYKARLILLDTDKRGLTLNRDAQALQLADKAGFLLVWQNTCHEALLLRHLTQCQTLRPPSTPTANAQLTQRWPKYEKPMTAGELAEKLDIDAVRRAATVEPELAAFLDIVGLL
jgi:hypothetical protein